MWGGGGGTKGRIREGKNYKGEELKEKRREETHLWGQGGKKRKKGAQLFVAWKEEVTPEKGCPCWLGKVALV